jgi:aminoglycoside phosphotransferase (APT) family kinase protein
VTLLCKYGAGPTVEVYGHKGGVTYEAEVYREVLQPLRERAPTPALYGAYLDPATGFTWLALEYLEAGERLNKTADPEAALVLAARWLGHFHAAAASLVRGRPAGFLNAYDPAYYRGWARRTAEFAGPLHGRFPWLRPLCRHFEELLPLLRSGPPLVIHGEYYPENVLLRGGAVYPVDWESAAVAAGEIDLASLTQGWPADVARPCDEAYGRARWPQGAPPTFPRALAVARLYGFFRWLGDRPEWTTARGALWQFRGLRALGLQLGVI